MIPNIIIFLILMLLIYKRKIFKFTLIWYSFLIFVFYAYWYFFINISWKELYEISAEGINMLPYIFLWLIILVFLFYYDLIRKK